VRFAGRFAAAHDTGVVAADFFQIAPETLMG
jgi:hypothetical protein